MIRMVLLLALTVTAQLTLYAQTLSQAGKSSRQVQGLNLRTDGLYQARGSCRDGECFNYLRFFDDSTVVSLPSSLDSPEQAARRLRKGANLQQVGSYKVDGPEVRVSIDGLNQMITYIIKGELLTLETLEYRFVKVDALGPQTEPPQAIKMGRVFFIVSDLDNSIHFYRDLIGLEQRRPRSRMGPSIPPLYGSPDASIDAANLTLPAEDSSLQLLQFLEGSRQPTARTIQDPGAVRLILTVRDIAPIISRLQKANVETRVPGQSNGAKPRLVLVRDPDGFFVELSQTENVGGKPPSVSGNFLSVRLGLTVSDTEAALRVYHDALGFETQAGKWTKPDKKRADVASMVGFAYRRSAAKIQGSYFPLEFLQFENAAKSANRRSKNELRDPGSVNLELSVIYFDQVVRSLTRSGSEIVSTAGPEALDRRGARRLILRGPDNLFLEPAP